MLNSWFKNPPFIKFIPGPNPKSVGFYVDVLNALQSQLNFTTESVAPRKGKWGRPQGCNSIDILGTSPNPTLNKVGLLRHV